MLTMLKRNKQLRTVDYLPSIGEYSTGEPLTVDPYDLKHWLITGATRGGKSSYINALLNVLQNYDFQHFGIDCKRGLELKPWSHLFTKLAVNVEQVQEVLNLVKSEMDTRLDHLDAKGLRKWPYKDRVVLVVDEFSQALALDYALADKQAKLEARQRLDSFIALAQLGLAAGVHLILSTQTAYANTVSGELKNNLDVRICCKVNSPEMLKTGLGDSYGLDYQMIPPYPGCAYVLGLPDCLLQPRIARAFWVEQAR